MSWRRSIEKLIKSKTDASITFIHTPFYCDDYMSNNEQKIWRLRQICDSDIVIVNMKNIDTDVYAYYELGYIDAINSSNNKKIYLVGVGDVSSKWSWAAMSLFHHETTMENAAEHVASYLLL